MKLPKELQKKKHKSSSNLTYERLKKNIISTFRREIIKISHFLNDTRKLRFKSPGDSSKFSKFIGENEKKSYNAKTHWDEFEIEFYLNNKDDSDYFIHLRENPTRNFEKLKNIVKYVARHEFGHTLLVKSIYYLKPKEERNLLNELRVTNLDDIPQSSREEFFNRLRKIPYFMHASLLKNVNLEFLLEEYREFHANYTVYKKIDNSTTYEVLDWKINQIYQIVVNLRKHKEELLHNIRMQDLSRTLKINEFFFLFDMVFKNTFEFFVFPEWDKLTPIFEQYDMIYLLYFMHLLTETFKRIADNTTDYDLMIDSIINLAKVIEKIDFEKLVFDNFLPEEIQNEIKKFL